MTPARALGHPHPDDWIVSLNIVIVCLHGVILRKLQNLTLCLKTIPHLAIRLRSVERDAVLCFPYFSPNLFRPKWLKVVSHFWVPLFYAFQCIIKAQELQHPQYIVSQSGGVENYWHSL